MKSFICFIAIIALTNQAYLGNPFAIGNSPCPAGVGMCYMEEDLPSFGGNILGYGANASWKKA